MTEPSHVPQTRHIMRELLPPWLKRSLGDSLCAEGLFTVYDLDAEYMRDALLARMPSYAPADALPLIAADRGVPIGPAEPEDVLRVRLILWLDFLQLAGLPLGLLLAMQAVLAPAYPTVRVVTQQSLWYLLEEGAVGRMLALPGYEPLPPTTYELGPNWPAGQVAPAIERLRAQLLLERLVVDPPNWDWDSESIVHGSGGRWSAWVIAYSVAPTDWVAPEGNWGDPGDWGDGGYWGVEFPAGVDPGNVYHETMGRFKPAGSWIRWFIVSFDPVLFDAEEPEGLGVNPDGRFGRWSKTVNGQAVPARFENARYFDGVA